MTQQWEQDATSVSFMQQAKFLFATKIKGESLEDPM
jgi:hypothetical protein